MPLVRRAVRRIKAETAMHRAENLRRLKTHFDDMFVIEQLRGFDRALVESEYVHANSLNALA